MCVRSIFAVFALVWIGLFCSAACPVGDLDGNCTVGLGDLIVFAGFWLDESGGTANLDGLHRVDMSDFSILADHWGDFGYRLVINEIMADNKVTIEDSDEEGEYPDWIEIYNPGAIPIDIGGMFLTDTLSVPTMWRIPTDAPLHTTIQPGRYLILWADEDVQQGPLHLGFKLSAGGEQVGLYDSTGVLIDGIIFGNQGTDKSYGRFPNGGPGWQQFGDGTATPGRSNGGESADAGIIINEIMYHPGHNESALEPEPLGLEYIELFNTGTSAVNLGKWRFVDGITYEVPLDTMIGAKGFCIIAADAAAFSARFPSVENVVGGWTGKLSNKGEQITLVNAVGTVIDRLEYSDEGDWSQRILGPLDYNHRGWLWSDAHDGGGRSLELISLSQSNEYGQNWKASLTDGGSPGRENTVYAADAAPFIHDVRHTPVMPDSGQTVTVTAKISDESGERISAALYWRVDTSVYIKSQYPVYKPETYTAVTMLDDGLHGDGQSGDAIYGATIPAQFNGAIIEFFINVSDTSANTRTWPGPCEVDGQSRQVANMLYQVNDSFSSETFWIPGKQPMYYIIMTEAERARIEAIGAGDNYERFSDAQMNATFISVDGVDAKTRYAVGVRNRGEGSRRLPPNNYHINFRHDNPWKNVTAININSKYTYLQLVGSAIFRMAGLAAAEGTAVQVRVNGDNLALTDTIPSRMYGTYIHLETIDSDFTENHFPADGGGNIYKASIYPQVADMTYLGTTPADYVERGYTKGTNESENDWSDLFGLTNVLDNEPDATYLEKLEQVIDTEQWIRWYAVQTLIGNNETNLGNGYGDDYQMYCGVLDPRFTLVTYDMDTILGGGDSPASFSDSIWRAVAPHTNVQMVVIQRFLQHPEYVWRYYAELKKLTETVFAPENMNVLLDSLLADFVPESKLIQLKQFVLNRNASVLAQIPQTFSVAASLSVVNGYYRTTNPTASVNGTADATQTRSVRVNGALANWSGVQGTWSVGTSVALKPGINRIIVQTFNNPEGMGTELNRGFVDIWYDNGNDTSLSGTLSSDRVLDAASGPWHVTGDVVIPAGVTLSVQAGASVFFDAETGITVNGKLIAEGTEYARIRFTRVPGGSSWDGLAFQGTLEDSRIKCLDMEYGDVQGNSVTIDASKITIDNVTWISTNNSTRILELSHPSALIRNCILPAITGTEPIHGVGLVDDEYLIFEGNTFGSTTGYNDIIDFTGGQRPGPIIQLYNNTFLGGGDDGPDLDGTDAHIEGNLFAHFHRTSPDQDSPSYAVATGDQSQVCIVRNVFVDNDHAILHKEEVYSWTQNNTIINSSIAAISFGEPFRSTPRDPGKGTWLAGNIFWDNAAIFEHYFDNPPGYGPTGSVGIYNSVLPEEWHFFGIGNIDADPMLKNPMSDWTLLPGSPAIGTGSNNQDIGADVPAGASVSGEPNPMTWETSATLTVSGPGITHFKYRLVDNGLPGLWSSEIALPVNADNFPEDPNNVSAQVHLTGFQQGHSYHVDVVGKNSAGLWQGQQFRDTSFIAQGNSEGNASAVWTVDFASHILRINEVMASNASVEHEATYPDMIELYYDGPVPIDLGGYRLTDNVDLQDKFVFSPDTVMSPGDYLILYADADNSKSGIHTGFSLDSDGDDLYLSNPSGVIIDSVVFGMQLKDMSIGRSNKNGQWTLTEPTFGSVNTAVPRGDPRKLKINEWLSDGNILFVNDWVEIYNPSRWPVDMGGLYITDDPVAEPNKYRMPPLSYVGETGYAVFAADDTNAGGHLPFNLSADGEMLALNDADLHQIDKVIYSPHMTDASQGRSPDGESVIQFFDLPTPGAANVKFTTTITADELVIIDDIWSYDQSKTEFEGWYTPGFNDSTWKTGAALLYVEGSSLPAPKNTPLTIGANTYYFRKHFTFSGNPGEIDTLAFSVVIDDGAVFYLNGHRIHAIRLGDSVSYSTAASQPAVDNAVYEYFNISPTYLLNGDNVMAVEVHQVNSTSGDIVFGMKLDAVKTTTVFEDIYINDRAVLSGLRITEIMYNSASDPNSEFIELKNISDTEIDLEGIRFTDGIAFVFPKMTLEPDHYTVVVADRGVFEARYGMLINVAGEYGGKLDNNGEQIVLRLAEPLEAAVMRFEYKDGWYPSTDGGGHSLVIADPAGTLASWQNESSWRQSVVAGGSPGRNDIATVIINEVLAHSEDAAPDWIELYNASGVIAEIGGWYLSDDSGNLKKYTIAVGTTIDPYSYKVFYENMHFGNVGDPGSSVQFGLSENGETAYLSSGQEGALTGYVVQVGFGASETGVSIGRYEKSDETTAFVLLSSVTPNDVNADPKVGPIVISEIMYNPPVGGAYPEQDYEYIELHNITGLPVTLDVYDPGMDITLGWRFTQGIDFVFPVGTTIPEYGFLVVAKNPAAFAERYGFISGVTVLGPYENDTKLSNDGELLELSKPGDTDLSGTRYYILVDSVRYDDTFPWPATPDGDGQSLGRLNVSLYGDDIVNWQAQAALPGI